MAADPRTFTLIGDFQDNITPALESINTTIGRFKRQVATMTNSRTGGFSAVTQSVGKLVSAQKHLKTAITEVGDAAKTATQELREYKSMMGKVASAHYHINKSGTAAGRAQAKFWDSANDSLEEYEKRMRALMRMTRVPNAPRYPSTAMVGRRGGRGVGPGPVGSGGRVSRGDSYGGGFHMAPFTFGMMVGQGISEPLTAAIFSGFNLGVGLLQQALGLFTNSFQERVQDQMGDLQAAGGYYSISQRQKNPMFASLQMAIEFTRKNNAIMARMAGDLPGTTEDFVKVSKRIGDSVMRMVDANERGSIAFAQELLKKSGTAGAYKGLSLEGPKARESAIQIILGELTKKTVLAGFGGTQSRGGVAGPYALPALIERLLTNPEVTEASLTRYASVFGDPKIQSALARAMPELQAAGADMVKRAKIINKMMDEIVPPEMIAAMRKSMAGIMEAYRSAIFSPETGLLGFGRILENISVKQTNVNGEFIKIENGIEKVVYSAREAGTTSLSVFEMFADIVANYAAVIKPIVDNLYLLWDPLEAIGKLLVDARTISIKVLQSFREYSRGLKEMAKNMSKEKAEKLLSTGNLRATLATLNNLFLDIGAFTRAQFDEFAKVIEDPEASIERLGQMVGDFIITFFDSKAAENIGKLVGSILQSVLVSLSEGTGLLEKLSASRLVSGFLAGFGEKGAKAFYKIFDDIYSFLFKAVLFILPRIPWQVYATAAAAVLIPASLAAVSMAFAETLSMMITRMGTFAIDRVKNLFARKGVEEAVEDIARYQYRTNTGWATPGRGHRYFAEKYADDIPDAAPKPKAKRPPGWATSGRGQSYFKDKYFGEYIRGKFDNFLKQLFGPIDNLIDNTGPVLKNISSKFKNINLGSILMGIVDLVIIPLDNLRLKISSLGILGKLKNLNFGSILMGIVDLVIIPLDNLRLSLPGILKKINFGQLISKIDKKLLYIAEVTDLAIDNLFRKINFGQLISKLDGLGAVFTRPLDNLLDALYAAGKNFSPYKTLTAPGKAVKGIPGFLGGLLGKGKNAIGGGITGLVRGLGKGLKGLKNPFKTLGKFGSIATVGFGIFEALMSLLSGDSLGTALGKGAGPVLGTLIGTALLGPIGGLIGGWIGSMKSVTEPLAQAFSALENSLKVGGDLLVVIGKDLGWLINSIRGVDGEFDLLRFAVNALLSPFKMLELGIRGLYVLYLKMRSSLAPLDKEKRKEFLQADVELAMRTADFEGKSKQQQLAEARERLAMTDPSVKSKKMKELEEKLHSIPATWFKERLEAAAAINELEKQSLRMDPERDKLLVKMLEQQAKDEARPTGTQATLNGKAVEWNGSKWVEKDITQVASGAKDLSDAKDVPKDITQTKDAAQKTEKNTATSVTTLGNIKAGIIAISNKVGGLQTAILGDLNNIQAGVSKISSLLHSGTLKVKFSMADGAYGMSGGGGYGGGGVALAGMLGNWMKSTGGAPGSIWEHPWHGGVKAKHADGSLHYAGRAIDIGAYAHEQGPILARIAQFNKMMGITPTQLFHAGNDPKGHGDHVHVAYGLGQGNPAFFSSQSQAERWERSMVSGSTRVASITGNSAEGFGSGVNVTNNISITQQPGQSAEELASLVALKIGEAVSDARASSIFT